MRVGLNNTAATLLRVTSGAVVATIDGVEDLICTQAPNVTVAAVAVDAIGAEAAAFAHVTVSEVSLSGAALANATQDALDEAFAASSLDAVCQVAFAVDTADDPDVGATLVSALGAASDAFVDVDAGLVEQTLGALVGPVAANPGALTDDTAREALELVRGLAEGSEAAGLGQGTTSTSSSTADVLSGLLASPLFEGYGNATRRRLSNATADDDAALLDTVDSLAAAQLATLALDEEAVGTNSSLFKSSNRVTSAAASVEAGSSAAFLPVGAKLSLSEFGADPHESGAAASNVVRLTSSAVGVNATLSFAVRAGRRARLAKVATHGSNYAATH